MVIFDPNKSFCPFFFFSTLGAWCAGVNNKQQYLQIDFQGMRKVTEVASQGRPDSNDYVSSYMLSFSLDGNLFEFHRLVSFFRLIFHFSQAAVLVSCVEQNFSESVLFPIASFFLSNKESRGVNERKMAIFIQRYLQVTEIVTASTPIASFLHLTRGM